MEGPRRHAARVTQVYRDSRSGRRSRLPPCIRCYYGTSASHHIRSPWLRSRTVRPVGCSSLWAAARLRVRRGEETEKKERPGGGREEKKGNVMVRVAAQCSKTDPRPPVLCESPPHAPSRLAPGAYTARRPLRGKPSAFG
jgi:hypothetical protein